MPINPERRALYPGNWPEISSAVRIEAGERCEECGIANQALGYRWPKRGGEFREVDPKHSVAVCQCLRDLRGEDAVLTRIVLTVHHLDGDPTNNVRENLVALCQRCHLRADQKLRKSRAATL